MKKRFLSLVLALMCFGVLFGCGDGYIEVCSVSYNDGTSNKTLNSVIEIEYTEDESITKIEYDIAKDEDKTGNSIKRDRIVKINTDKGNMPDYYVDKTYYWYHYDVIQNGSAWHTEYNYYKFTITSVKIDYVKIKTIDDKRLMIQYKDETYEVLAESYTITYFN